jgi:hypothetical protein
MIDSRMRGSHPAIFQDPVLYHYVMKMLENYHFRLPARKFIQDVLFDQFKFSSKNWEKLSELSTV